eukprot:m.310533 g.310533  ORF g.310533 m.310533 type:complete len:200 (+) comp16383_c0_seq4:13-612(+)
MAGRACLFLGLKYGTGDLIAQHLALSQHSDGGFDRRRAAMFAAFGGYYGLVFYGVVRALNAMPIPNPWTKAVVSSLIDGFVHVPALFLPQFYVFKEVVTGPKREFEEHSRVGLNQWVRNWQPDMIASAGVFVPLGIINFRFITVRWRVPFLATTSVLYPVILSYTRGASEYSEQPIEEASGAIDCAVPSLPVAPDPKPT